MTGSTSGKPGHKRLRRVLGGTTTDSESGASDPPANEGEPSATDGAPATEKDRGVTSKETERAAADQRQYPRINIPLLVELKHPTLGTHRTTAENISAGGLFVNLTFGDSATGLQADQIKPNARLKVRLLNAAAIEPQATPTVEMVVTRVTQQGVGLKFSNQTSQFLWESAERKRVELAIGRDYFQVHVSALVQHEQKLLLVEERGHWVFPGCYLKVGEGWQASTEQVLNHQLGLTDLTAVGPLQFHNQDNPTLPAVATLRLFYLFTTNNTKLALAQESAYRDYRWLDKARTLADLTFANEVDRDVTQQFVHALTLAD